MQIDPAKKKKILSRLGIPSSTSERRLQYKEANEKRREEAMEKLLFQSQLWERYGVMPSELDFAVDLTKRLRGSRVASQAKWQLKLYGENHWKPVISIGGDHNDA